MSTQSDIRPEVDSIRSNPKTQVLIIGGGINGIGTFRDLALQGVDVVLIDRGDYASGASSASSHMIHGGVRYLENGEFRLVRESVQERNRLLRLAPHYVKPLATTIPIFSIFSGILSAPLRFLTHKQGKPKERGALLIKLGLLGYDSFSRDGGNVPRHKFVGRKKSLAKLPKLRPDVKFTATYYDATVENPERLALDLVQDALAAGPHARTANYVEAVGSDGDSVVLRDMLSGETFEVTADVVVNTSGPWTDLTNSTLGEPTKFMGGTKGSHIVLDNQELFDATGGTEVFFENDDGRIVLINPLNGRVLTGTTDLEADPSEPSVTTEAEIDYFFGLMKHVFPTIKVDRSQIIYRYSGIRPLPGHGDTAPGFVSRDYRIEQSNFADSKTVKQLSLVGGKWTTFRALSEHMTNEALALLGRQRTVSTTDLPIGGGAGFPQTPAAVTSWVKAHGADIGEARARVLLARYGTKAAAVIDFIVAQSDTSGGTGAVDTPLATLPGYSNGEIAYLMTEEHTVHLIDLLLRRTLIAFVGLLNQASFDELSALAAKAAGWTPERLAEERAQTVENLRFFHGIELEATSATATAAS
ncbi:glycerol-3-phosphate dehydrogenase/oxidase [Herbiconiux sp. CPCC 205763]|uniref:Glycerol-3-phosphate dehydrogenase/oxidase n=1 Tax=Herbiconiux aconitum TaxID=2970913 RepID=A0ABT2GTM1_9MICO|nr:glycerol-3-phosphate dehydrogenase/oxidase [Herbiconiux aconitum]MCS5718907.1 glycerol-3-phosphate dehydrogenase/oxidase [Herbiconiux aconitum]